MQCKICNSPNLKLKTEDKTFIWHCSNCNVKFLFSFPDQALLNQLYTEKYFESEDKEIGYKDYLKEEKIHRLNANELLDILEPIDEFRLLDFGCSYGFLLDEARKRMYEVGGVDICGDARNFCRNVMKLDVKEKLEDWQDNRFDIVTMIGTLEHLIDPIETLNKINSMLNRFGLLLITTNNHDWIMPIKWKGIEHPFCYSRKSVDNLLTSCGFEVVYSKIYCKTYEVKDALYRAKRYFKLPFDKLNFITKYIKTIKILNNEICVLARKV